jgi:hypothetical protein
MWAIGSLPVRLNIWTLQLGSKGGMQSIKPLLCSSGVIRNGSEEGAFYYYFATTANTVQSRAVIWTENGINLGNWLCSAVYKFHFLSNKIKCMHNMSIHTHIYIYIYIYIRARSSVFHWGTMLQAGRPRVWFPMRSLVFFFNWPNPSSRTMDLWSIQPLTEMSARSLPGGKGRPACKADNLTAIWDPTV